MRRARLAVLSALAVLALGLVLAACNSESSGACTGNEDGTYFQLQLYSVIPSQQLEARLNGRFIGNVPAPQTDGMGNIIAAGESRLGEFPVCDKNALDARGGGNQGSSFTEYLCSTPQAISAACAAAKPDYCWDSFFFLPANSPGPGQPGGPAIPGDFQSPQCYLAPGNMNCDTNGNPGAGTFPCFPCRNDWINNGYRACPQ